MRSNHFFKEVNQPLKNGKRRLAKWVGAEFIGPA